MVKSDMTKLSYIDLPTIGMTFANTNTPLVNPTDRTVEIVASDETPVSRFDWYQWQRYNLVLSHDPAHANLSRVDSGVCMFLEDHQACAEYELGKFTSYTLDNGKLKLKAKLHPTEKADLYLAKCLAGTQPGNSVGINVYEMEVTTKAVLDGDGNVVTPATMTAINWELIECSSVTIPANPNTCGDDCEDDDEGDDGEDMKLRSKTHRVILHGDPGYKLSKDNKMGTEQKNTDTAINLANDLRQELLSVTQQRDEAIAQVTALKLSLETAQNEVTLSRAEKRRFEVEKRYHGLKQKAIGLRDSMQLSAKEFDRYFSVSEAVDIEKLSGNMGNVYMDECDAYLDRVSEREELLPTKLKVSQPIESPEDNTDEADAFLAKSGTQKFSRSY